MLPSLYNEPFSEQHKYIRNVAAPLIRRKYDDMARADEASIAMHNYGAGFASGGKTGGE